MQAVTPKALPMAVATTMITLRMIPQTDFFRFFFHEIVDYEIYEL